MLQHGPKLAQLGSNLGPKTSPKGAPRPLPRATFDGKLKTLILTTVWHFFYIFGVPGGLWETRFRLKIDVPKQHLFQECLETLFYHKNTEKSKKCRKWVPKGGAQGGPRMWFSEILGFLGPPGGHHGSQTSPQGTPDPSEPSFLMILGLILGRFFYDFGLLFVSMFCRIVLAFSLHFWHALR